MSLEKRLEENTVALEANTKAIEALLEMQAGKIVEIAKAPEKAKPADKKAKATPAEEEEEEIEEELDDASESQFDDEDEDDITGEGEEQVTLKDLQTALKELVAETDKDNAKKLLKKFGVAKLPDLDEEKFADLLAAINKQLKK